MSESDIDHATAFLAVLDRWEALVREWYGGRTPRYLADYSPRRAVPGWEQFEASRSADAEKARAILADLDMHGATVVRLVAQVGEDSSLVLGWLVAQAEPWNDTWTAGALAAVRHVVRHALVLAEAARGNADGAAYRPAKEFLGQTGADTYKALQATLKAHPQIRTRKPSKNRLLIHAGDWLAATSAGDTAASNALDVSPETVTAFLVGARERHEEIRRRKVGGGK
jgi:hypothetical protein